MTTVTHIFHLGETEGRQPFGGAEHHLFVLLKGLAARGAAVEAIILLTRDGPALRAARDDLEAGGVAVHTVPYRPSWDWRAFWTLRRMLAARRAHIIHTHMAYADLIGKAAARSAGCRYVMSSIHNTALSDAGRRELFIARVLKYFTTHYVAISEAAKALLVEKAFVNPGRVTVIYYGINAPAAIALRDALRARHHMPLNRFIVGFVGRLTYEKNIPLLIEAMAALPEMHCVLAGDGALSAELEALVAQKRLANVQFLGYVPGGADVMPAFDVLCLPSVREGLGLVLLEAMLRRVPIVASRVGPIPEVLQGGEYGVMFESGDMADLVEALRRMQRDAVLRADLAARAYDYAKAMFTVEKMVERTLEVYRRLVD